MWWDQVVLLRKWPHTHHDGNYFEKHSELIYDWGIIIMSLRSYFFIEGQVILVITILLKLFDLRITVQFYIFI